MISAKHSSHKSVKHSSLDNCNSLISHTRLMINVLIKLLIVSTPDFDDFRKNNSMNLTKLCQIKFRNVEDFLDVWCLPISNMKGN